MSCGLEIYAYETNTDVEVMEFHLWLLWIFHKPHYKHFSLELLSIKETVPIKSIRPYEDPTCFAVRFWIHNDKLRPQFTDAPSLEYRHQSS